MWSLESDNNADEEVREPFLQQDTPCNQSRPTNANKAMPTRKLIRLAKFGATFSLLVLIFIIITALFAHRRVSQMIINPFHTDNKLGVSHVYIEQRDKAVYNLRFTNKDKSVAAGDYLSISFPYNLKSRSDDPKEKRCEFSLFNSSYYTSIDDLDVLHEYRQSCFEFEDQIRAAVYETDVFKGLECYVVHWYSNKENPSIENCIEMKTNGKNMDYWYGGGALSLTRWPLHRANIPLQPYITSKVIKTHSSSTGDGHFASFLEPYFLSSNGVGVLLNENLPLFMSININDNKQICFKTAFEKPFDTVRSTKNGIHLNYTVCKDNSARAIHEQFLELGIIQHPKQEPREDILQKPVWSTRGQNISNETSLLSFVRNIKNFNLNFSQLLIDGNYTKSSGDFNFNEKRFPHYAQIIMELDEKIPEKNLKVGTEVYPFIPDSISDGTFSFNEDINKSRTLTNPILLNVFNDKACEWYVSQLKDIQQQIRVDGFRFSGGDAASFLLPNGSMKPFVKSKIYSFNEITTKYSYIASQFGDSSFLGSGYKSQFHGLVSDAGPFLSTWEHFRTIIPTVLTFGLMGYSFVSTGPIGGISRETSSDHFTLPSKELYIKWLELSIFLPVVEFSTGPWVYGPEVVKHAENLLRVRQKELWPNYLSAAIKEAVDVGTPIIRPLWWISPDDLIGQNVDDEFLVGNSLLVAPSQHEGRTDRDIYLPKGSWWKDVSRGTVHEGGHWLEKYIVNEYEIPRFIRTNPPDPAKSKS